MAVRVLVGRFIQILRFERSQLIFLQVYWQSNGAIDRAIGQVVVSKFTVCFIIGYRSQVDCYSSYKLDLLFSRFRDEVEVQNTLPWQEGLLIVVVEHFSGHHQILFEVNLIVDSWKTIFPLDACLGIGGLPLKQVCAWKFDGYWGFLDKCLKAAGVDWNILVHWQIAIFNYISRTNCGFRW